MDRAVPPEVEHAARVVSPFLDTRPLTEALLVWTEPAWRVVVTGRVSAGKSTLVNALAGERVQPVGLGGVTTSPVEITTGLPADTVVVDTPGLDGDERIPPSLDEALPGADAVIWVVDGLQPVTETERLALGPRLLPGTALHVVVSRADLLPPDELPAVLERVRALTAIWSPASVQALDLRERARRARHEADARPHALVTPLGFPSPRRIHPVLAALQALEQALDAREEPPDLGALQDDLCARWREMVVATREGMEAAIGRGAFDHKQTARRRLALGAKTRRGTFLADLADHAVAGPLVDQHGPPDLPLPDPPSDDLLETLVGGIGGAASALRDTRAAAGRWMIEGELALADWLAPLRADEPPAAQRAQWAAAREAVGAALARMNR